MRVSRDLKLILVSLFLFARICSWSSFRFEVFSLSLESFWIFGPWIRNVFVRKNTSALIVLPWIMKWDFCIAASSHRCVYSVIAVVISAASFRALSTW